MKMTKSELKEMIRGALREALMQEATVPVKQLPNQRVVYGTYIHRNGDTSDGEYLGRSFVRDGKSWDGMVYDTKEEAIAIATDVLNDMFESDELPYPADYYTIETYPIPISRVPKRVLDQSCIDRDSSYLEESTTSHRFIIACNGGAGGTVYYMGTDIGEAFRRYRQEERDFIKYSIGGGDTTLCLYEYKGPVDKFEQLYNIWKTDENATYYNRNIEELGISLRDCTVIDSAEA
jgi:hypothetical protein